MLTPSSGWKTEAENFSELLFFRLSIRVFTSYQKLLQRIGPSFLTLEDGTEIVTKRR
jgi:hypothetical protein